MQRRENLSQSRHWGDREFVWAVLVLTALLVWAANVVAPTTPTGSRHRNAATVVAEQQSGEDVARQRVSADERPMDD